MGCVSPFHPMLDDLSRHPYFHPTIFVSENAICQRVMDRCGQTFNDGLGICSQACS